MRYIVAPAVGLFVAFWAGAAAAENSTLCHFTGGPRAGETQDYAPRAGIPVGSSCQDGAGSYGRVVGGSDNGPPSNGRGGQREGYSTVCVFTRGPRAGESHDYAPQPAIPVGSACQDGAGSTGVVR